MKWTAAPKENVHRLLTGFEPFSKLSDSHSVLSQGAMQWTFDEADTIPVDVLNSDRMFVLAAGDIVFHPKSGSRTPVTRLSPGAQIFCPQASAETLEIVAVTPAKIFMLPPSASSLVWHDTAYRTVLHGGPLRPEEIWFACAAETKRRGLETTPAFHASREDSVVRFWPKERELIETSGGYYIWIIAAAEGVETGTVWSRDQNLKWARLIGFPATALDNCKKLVAKKERTPRTPKVSAAQQPLPPQPAMASAPLRPPPNWRRRKKLFRLAMAVLGIGVALTAIILWNTPVKEQVTVRGELEFCGRIQPLAAEFAGEIAELKIAPNSKIEANALIAIVKPPLDEQRVKELAKIAETARVEEASIRRVMSGKPPDDKLPADVVAMVKDKAASRSDLRVSLAVKYDRTLLTLPTIQSLLSASYDVSIWGTDLDADEIARFTAQRRAPIAGASAPMAKPSGLDSSDTRIDDVETKRGEVREAESELQAAREQLRIYQEAEIGLREKAASRFKSEREEYQRAKNDVQKQSATLGSKSARVESVKKQLNAIARSRTFESTPESAGTPPDSIAAPPETDIDRKIGYFKSHLAELEAQIRERAETARKAAETAEQESEKLRKAAEPREVHSKFAGTISDSLPTTGNSVAVNLPIAHVITDFRWKANFKIPPEVSKQITQKTPFTVSLDDSDISLKGTASALPTAEGRLSVMLQEKHEDLPKKAAVHSSVEIITGNQLTRTFKDLFRSKP